MTFCGKDQFCFGEGKAKPQKINYTSYIFKNIFFQFLLQHFKRICSVTSPYEKRRKHSNQGLLPFFLVGEICLSQKNILFKSFVDVCLGNKHWVVQLQQNVFGTSEAAELQNSKSTFKLEIEFPNFEVQDMQTFQLKISFMMENLDFTQKRIEIAHIIEPIANCYSSVY